MEDDENEVVLIQRLKAAVHYTVGKVCEESAKELEQADEQEIRFTKQFMAAVAEATFAYSQSLGRDLELFAKHAKRTTVSMDDVLLTARKSKLLTEHLRSCAEGLTAVQKEKQQNVKRRETKKKTNKDTDTVAQANIEEFSLDYLTEDSNL